MARACEICGIDDGQTMDIVDTDGPAHPDCVLDVMALINKDSTDEEIRLAELKVRTRRRHPANQ